VFPEHLIKPECFEQHMLLQSLQIIFISIHLPVLLVKWLKFVKFHDLI